MRKTAILALAMVFSLAIVSIAFAEYAATRVYFNVPSATTFTIFVPDEYTGSGFQYLITGSSQGAATDCDWITFNFSSAPDSWQIPSFKGNFTRNQTGVSGPIWYVDNTGNVNQTFTIYTNETDSPPFGTYFNISVNASCSPSADYCNYTETTAFNITKGATLIANRTDPTGFINITMWGFAETGAPGGESTAQWLIFNSSETT